jgi:hypothetical protein
MPCICTILVAVFFFLMSIVINLRANSVDAENELASSIIKMAMIILEI